MEYLIQIKELKKVYQATDVETLALDNVSIDIANGEFLAIMGPSGCGKSTLLSILGLFEQPTSGKFYLEGKEISNYSETALSKLRNINIGFIFQNFNLIEDLTVFENIVLPLQYRKINKRIWLPEVEKMLERVNISHRRNHKPSQLSGGLQQRAAIARALVTNPKLLLADEPTGNLDTENGANIIRLLKEINLNGTTVVMVTHSPDQAKAASRQINLLDGRVVS